MLGQHILSGVHLDRIEIREYMSTVTRHEEHVLPEIT
jgi:hypothetical protein